MTEDRNPIMEERNRSRTPGGMMMKNGSYFVAYMVLLALLSAFAKLQGVNFRSEIHFLIAVGISLAGFLYLVKLVK